MGSTSGLNVPYIIIRILAALLGTRYGDLEVTAPAGTFSGTTITSNTGQQVRAFLGIPYALPPVGNLRFAKPQPYPKIQGTFEATQNAPVCIQMAGVDLGSPASEDCLYLNVYTPLPQEPLTTPRPLKKVFVYIYGGGFFMGSAYEQVPADWLAQEDGVIVVTFNYRLGWLGFVRGNTPETPGNMGFWDQLMAIQWVKDNIRSFGGDPDDITIGGNSAGSGSVSVLSISPYSKGLFTKGVMLSYTLFNNTATYGDSDSLLFTLADTVGCSYSSRVPCQADKVVECLRQLPAEAFSLPFDVARVMQFLTIDGDLMPYPVRDIIRNQTYLSEVGFYERDYITSVTPIEGVIFIIGVFTFTTEELAVNPAYLQALTGLPLSVAEDITYFYSRPWYHQYNAAWELIGDLVLLMPSMTFAETFAAVDRNTYQGHLGNSYVMVVDFTPTYMPDGYEGHFHALDLCYSFDLGPSKLLDLYYNMNLTEGFTQEDWDLKKNYIASLTQFLKTGTPGVSLTGGVNWPTFDRETEFYLKLTRPEPQILQRPFLEKRNVWKGIFPEG